MRRIALALVPAAALAVLAACGDSAPPYKVVSDEGPSIVVQVDRMPAEGGLREVFDAVREEKDRPDGGYFVMIDCSAGGSGTSSNRLGIGKFAVGPLGEAATGLKPGSAEFEARPGASCP